MNFVNESNNLNAARKRAEASASVKQESPYAPYIKVGDHKQSGEEWSFPLIKTSPIVCASANKVVQKRKKRQNWSKVEDDILIGLVGNVFESNELKWPQIAAEINKTFDSFRTGKQCRERWLNHLRPDIKKGNWTADEEFMIEYFYNTFGPKWSTMAKLMKNRTDNDIKNKWNSMKRTEKAGRKKKKATTLDNPTHDLPSELVRVAEERETRHVDSSQWSAMGKITAPEHQTSDKMQLFINEKSSEWKYASETAILPTVTDGGSAENSPVPKKKYWNYEV